MQKPRKPLMIEEPLEVPEHAELISQLQMLAPLRKRKDEKAQAALAQAKATLEQLHSRHELSQSVLNQAQSDKQSRLATLEKSHLGETLNKNHLAFWLDNEQALLKGIYQKQQAVQTLAQHLDEQQTEIERLTLARIETDKQVQRLDLMLQQLKQAQS